MKRTCHKNSARPVTCGCRGNFAARADRITYALLAIVLVAGCGGEPPDPGPAVGTKNESLFARDRFKPGGGLGGVFVPPDPTPVLEGPAIAFFARRRSDRVDFRFRDQTDLEDRYEILRRTGNTGPHEVVQNYGVLDGYVTFADTTVSPDTLYCYRARAYQGSNWKQSPQACVYTSGSTPRPLLRAQLQIKVADVEDAGTDDSVVVRLNSPSSVYLPFGHETWLDYSHNDFERGSEHSYDIVPPKDLSDITLFMLEKSGTDGLCIESLRLVVNDNGAGNGTTVFEQNYGGTASTCHWIDGDDGHEAAVSFLHDALRASPNWPGQGAAWCGDTVASCATSMFPMTLETLEHRMEGMVGHLLHAFGPVSWDDDGSGAGSFSVTQTGKRTAKISGTFFGDGPLFVNARADLDVDLVLRAREVEGAVIMEPRAEGLKFDLDFSAFVDAAGYALSPIPGLNLADLLEMYIEGRVEDGFNPLSITSFEIPALGGSDCGMLRLRPNELRIENAPCDDLDGDDLPDNWERENGLDPDDDSDADADADGDGVSNIDEYRANTNPQCQWSDNHPNFCRDCGPCEAGQADCDSDAECRGGLVCSHDVGARYGLLAYYDVCECPWDENHPNFCRDCGPCEIGTGDCDSDAECAGSSVCSHNVGARYGLLSYYDVCECGLEPGHPDYCKVCGPCKLGEGDCDGSEQCDASTYCAEDVGEDFGFPARFDVCLCRPSNLCMPPGGLKARMAR